MRVECEIEEVELETEYGRDVLGVQATCSHCRHTTESFGTGEQSIKRCLALMRDECPKEENNYYVADTED